MDIPYTYKKLNCMRLDILADSILFWTDLFFHCVSDNTPIFRKYFNPKIKL